MEYYKQCKESGTKKEPALRTGLKRKRLEFMEGTSSSSES